MSTQEQLFKEVRLRIDSLNKIFQADLIRILAQMKSYVVYGVENGLSEQTILQSVNKSFAIAQTKLANTLSQFQFPIQWKWSQTLKSDQTTIEKLKAIHLGKSRSILTEPSFQKSDIRQLKLRVKALAENWSAAIWLVDYKAREEYDDTFAGGVNNDWGTYALFKSGWLLTNHECDLDGSTTGVSFDKEEIVDLLYEGPSNKWIVQSGNNKVQIPVEFEANCQLHFGAELFNAEIEILY